MYSLAIVERQAETMRARELVVHQIWMQGKPPPDIAVHIKTWRGRRHFSHRLWNERQIIALFRETFPPDEAEFRLKHYNMLERWAFKADVARSLILYVHGGLYVDADAECTRPMPKELLEHWRTHRECLVMFEASHTFLSVALGGAAALLNNHFIMCSAGHPFARRVLDLLTLQPPPGTSKKTLFPAARVLHMLGSFTKVNRQPDIRGMPGTVFLSRELCWEDKRRRGAMIGEMEIDHSRAFVRHEQLNSWFDPDNVRALVLGGAIATLGATATAAVVAPSQTAGFLAGVGISVLLYQVASGARARRHWLDESRVLFRWAPDVRRSARMREGSPPDEASLGARPRRKRKAPRADAE